MVLTQVNGENKIAHPRPFGRQLSYLLFYSMYFFFCSLFCSHSFALVVSTFHFHKSSMELANCLSKKWKLAITHPPLDSPPTIYRFSTASVPHSRPIIGIRCGVVVKRQGIPSLFACPPAVRQRPLEPINSPFRGVHLTIFTPCQCAKERSTTDGVASKWILLLLLLLYIHFSSIVWHVNARRPSPLTQPKGLCNVHFLRLMLRFCSDNLINQPFMPCLSLSQSIFFVLLWVDVCCGRMSYQKRK